MSMTRGEFPKPLVDDMLTELRAAYRDPYHLVYNRKAIAGWLISSFVLIVVYDVASSHLQHLLFGIVAGVATSLWFRPLDKIRRRYDFPAPRSFMNPLGGNKDGQ